MVREKPLRFSLLFLVVLFVVLVGCAENVASDGDSEERSHDNMDQNWSQENENADIDLLSTINGFIDVLETSSDISALTGLDDFQKYSPAAFEQITHNKEESCHLLLSLLLTAEETVVSTEEINPSIRLQYTCALLRYLVGNNGDEMRPSVDEKDNDFTWFRKFLFDACNQFRELNYNLDDSFYKNHVFQKQVVVAVLEQPLWRIVFFTEIEGDLVDQGIYMDAVNEFMSVLQHGTKSDRVSVPYDTKSFLEGIKKSNNQWSIVQNSDLSVDLLIPVENEIMALTYVPHVD